MTNSKYDSEFCGSLPIHMINLIQPYGVLIVVDANSYEIIQVSENADRIFAAPAERLVKSNLSRHIPAGELELLKKRKDADAIDHIPSVWEINGNSYLALIHPKKDFLLVELDLIGYEDQSKNTFVKVYQEIKYAMGLIQAATTVSEVARLTARELKRISQFDKVMIYRFDNEWNGNVIAEEMEEGMESYNGFTFPASDIPAPARTLYLKNPYRFIPTTEYQAVKMYPVINPVSNTFLDLSECNLRAVAAVHLEYLRNMRVEASMSTRILIENRLWGLIACHHRKEKNMSFEMRSIFEMISNIVSAKIASLHSADLHSLDSRLKEGFNNIIEDTYRHRNLQTALFNGEPDILALFEAQGAVISRRGKLYSKGEVPDPESLRELILWLHTRQLKGVYHSESLSSEYDPALFYKEKASGVIIIPINMDEDEYLMVFRPEVLRVVNWGGNPNERIFFDQDEKNYHPRHSFRLWQEQVEGIAKPWKPEEIQVAENLRSFIYEFQN